MPEAGRRTSLQWRLQSWLLVPLLALFAASGAVSYWLAIYFANEVYDGWLYDSASSLALLTARADGRLSVELPQSEEQAFVWDIADRTYYVVRGEKSGIVAQRGDLPDPGPDARDERGALLFDGVVDGAPVRVASLQLPADHFGERVTIEVAETMHKRHALARRILLFVMVPEGLLILIAGGLIGTGIRAGLRPLRSLGDRLSAHGHDKLEPLPDADIPVEILPLTGALNDLLERLGTAMVAQRKFIADAAHQLRTPLTALKLHIAETRRETTPEGVQRGLVQLEVATERASRLANQLLSLARMEPEAATQHRFESIDLLRLARETGAEWVPRAHAKGLELSFEAPEMPVVVHGEPFLLREALDNLLDNAVKYHPGPGRIVLGIRPESRDTTIEVCDDGPGVPIHLRERLFTRFFRTDTSPVRGSGLGLAIVKEIAQLHGAALTAGLGLEGRGLGIRMRLGASGR